MAYKINGVEVIDNSGQATANLTIGLVAIDRPGAELLRTIDNPNSDQSTNAYDYFGISVAISDNRAIVGAYQEDVPYSASGSAYIFDVNTGTLLHTINNPNSDQSTNTTDWFGYSVAISGNRAIVGAFFEDVPYASSGSAYIFNVSTGALLHTINNPNSDQSTNTNDRFGASVAIDGNRAIVGAYTEDVPYTDSGSAYIFDVNTGTLLHTINNPTTNAGTADYFGWSCSISGNRAIVGAVNEDVPYTDGGSAYIFDVNTGALLHTINNPNSDQTTTAADKFGASVAIDGNRAIVGAYQEDVPYTNSGSAYIFDVNTGTLLHTIDNPTTNAGTGDNFGYSVAISGNRAIVGAYGEDVPYTNSGSAYILDVNTGALLHTIDNPTTNAGTFDEFGISVAISGNRAIVGAYQEDVPYLDSGSAYIFRVQDSYDYNFESTPLDKLNTLGYLKDGDTYEDILFSKVT